uniref:Misato mitochondrial distribution and morphology regulator 1 n=1 Tax=Phasianus colchicus TaxID=9054 RepID=A0A669QP34_PHACC
GGRGGDAAARALRGLRGRPLVGAAGGTGAAPGSGALGEIRSHFFPSFLPQRRPPQDTELSHAALLRAGREGCTPRLIALELKGTGAADPPPGDQGKRPPWFFLLSPDAAPAPGSSTQLWSDYLSVQLHPRSIYVLQQYNHDGDSGRLEAFGQGEKLLQDAGCMEEVEDRLHFYVEECDYLQGFQVLCDLHDGFSGVGAKVTELLHDEYSRKGILTWGLTPVTPNMGDPQKNFYRVLNTALGIVHLSAHSSLFCPLSLSGSLGIKPQPPITFPYLNYDLFSAAVMQTLNLSPLLNQVVAAWAAVPFPAVRGHSLPDALCAHQQDVPWKLLSSCGEQKVSRCFAQSVVLRGICKENPTRVWGNFIQLLPGSASHILEQPCVTLPPYPHIFSSLLSRQGFLLDDLSTVESIPVLTSLQSSPALRTLLSDLCKDLQKLGTRRCASFFAAGVEEDDFHEAFQELRTLSQCYEMGFEGDNSEDESDSD